jgi:hypothetical protein
MVELDNFQLVNDSCGHGAGDAVLRSVGPILLELVRAEDTAVRHGGEEFVIIPHDSGMEGARRMTRELRRQMARIELPRMHAPEGDRLGGDCQLPRSRQDDRGAAGGGRHGLVCGQAPRRQPGGHRLRRISGPLKIELQGWLRRPLSRQFGTLSSRAEPVWLSAHRESAVSEELNSGFGRLAGTPNSGPPAFGGILFSRKALSPPNCRLKRDPYYRSGGRFCVRQ